MRAALIAGAAAALLAGCANFLPSAEQIKANPNGGVLCNGGRVLQGSGEFLMLNAEEIKRLAAGASTSIEIDIQPAQGCATKIKISGTGAAPKAASAP